ncbi:MAG: acyl-CoA thioesterase [Deltaproteobacteria bacterium]|nr:acyl-CoA thioesterase [Deltaproteobacteria bacterium]
MSISDFYSTSVKSTHLDMFGHVNNSVYLEYFEWARWDWANKNNSGFEDFLKAGIGVAAVRVEIDYLHELNHYDEVIISTFCSRKGKKSFTFTQKMMTGNNMCAIAHTTLVFINIHTRKAIDIPDSFALILENSIEVK